MPTSAFNKFNQFTADLASGVHNFSAHALKVALTNTAPVATNSVLANITQIAASGGYVAGGYDLDAETLTTAAGVAKLTIADEVITAAGGSIGPFQYAVIYNDTPTSPVGPLIGWVDYGSAVTLAAGESFTIDFDGTNGVFTIT